jgi:ankyrin repeat protein
MTVRLLAKTFVVVGVSVSAFAAPPDRRLIEASRHADLNAVRTLLKASVDPNTPEQDGTTALHWAAQQNEPAIADLLISAGANAKAANRYGVTPIYLAAATGSGDLIRKLLKAGANPEAALPEGDTPLMAASRAGNVDAVTQLLAGGAAVDAKETWRGQTALMLAADEDHSEVIKVLLAHSADVKTRSAPTKPGPPNRYSGYYDAAQGGFTALLFAVREGNLAAARLLLDAGADANDTLPGGFGALSLAILNAHYELAGLLLDHGANPNADGTGFTAFHQLIWTRDPNRHFNLPPAIPDGNLTSMDLARALVAHGANLNAPMTKEPRDGFRNWMNRIGSTPFILAAKAADAELMKFLLASGADPKIVAKDGTNALMAAAGIGYWPAESNGTEAEALEATRICMDLGYDVNTANDAGFTAIHGAAVRGANSIVQLLYDHGAKLDLRTKKERWMALNIADGVFLANTYKATPQTAEYLRKLMGITGERALGARNVYGVKDDDGTPQK